MSPTLIQLLKDNDFVKMDRNDYIGFQGCSQESWWLVRKNVNLIIIFDIDFDEVRPLPVLSLLRYNDGEELCHRMGEKAIEDLAFLDWDIDDQDDLNLLLESLGARLWNGRLA